MNRAREAIFSCPIRLQTLYAYLGLFLFAGGWVQDQGAVGPDRSEFEHLSNGVGDAIEGAAAQALTAQPVIFDEVNDRTLIRHAVIDKVLLSPGGDHQ